jgi:hypothetical protein
MEKVPGGKYLESHTARSTTNMLWDERRREKIWAIDVLKNSPSLATSYLCDLGKVIYVSMSHFYHL